MKKFMTLMMCVLTLGIAAPAFALDLQDARAQGLVGEKLTGYVAAVKASGDVNALVSEVNAKRKAEYQRISTSNGQPVDVVAKLASAQIIQGLSKGQLYEGADGSWKKR
jgi:hypothetical protein